MRLDEFERRARACFEAIPARFRERVVGPVIVPEVSPHPEFEGNYLLGECVHLPELSEGEELRSAVYLYYGSFVALAREDPDFDLPAEIEETVLHEVQHHLEDAVGHGGLCGRDWAGDQNQHRRRGASWSAGYWRAGERLRDEDHPTWAVDHDLFQEVRLSRDDWERAAREGLRLSALGRKVVIHPGELDAPPATATFEGYGRSILGSAPGDLFVELTREGGWLSRFNLFAGSP